MVGFLERLAGGRPAAHRRSRRGEHDRVGARAALLDHQHALRGRARDDRHDEPDVRGSDEQLGERTVSRLVEICGDGLPLFGNDDRRPPRDGRADLDDELAKFGSVPPGWRPPRLDLTCRQSSSSAPSGAMRAGQDHRPARRARRRGRALPGRQQRRPHDRARRRGVEAPPDPSGILYPGKCCVIGNGVVIDPHVLIDELDGLARRASTSAACASRRTRT